MANKSKQIYNPALNKGYLMLQGMQRQNRYNLNAQGQSYVSGSMKNASLDTDDYAHVEPSLMTPELDRIPTSEADLTALDNEKSLRGPSTIGTIWEGVKTPFRWLGEIGQGIDDTLWGKDTWHDVDLTAPSQVYRDFQYKRLSTQLTSTLNELNQLTSDQDYVDYIQNDFIPMLKNKSEADYTLQQLAKNGVKGQQLTDAYNRCKELQSAIDKVNNKLKQNVKTSGLLDNFYNINQRDKLSTGDKLKSYYQSLNDQYARHTGDATSNWWGKLMKSKNAWDVVKTIASPLVGVASDATDDIMNGARDIYNAATNDEDARNRTVLDQIKAHPNEHGYDNLFIDYSKDQNGKAGYQVLEDQLREQLPEFYRLKNQKKVEAIQAKDDLTKGNAWFDPSKLDKKFLSKQSSRDMGLLGGFMPQNLQYSLPELGSSFSDLKDFTALSVMDFAANNVIVPLVLTAATGVPGKVAKVMGLAETAGKVNKALEVSRAIQEALKIEGATTVLGKGAEVFKAARLVGKGLEATNGLKFGIGAAETAGGIYFTKQMRQQETNSEVMDAYSQKVLTLAMAKNVDMNRVIALVDEYAKMIGTDTEGLDPQQKIQMALGYNIKTDVPEFEKIKKDARRGLNKVYNDNMALAAQDYWEVMPFLNFNGAFMKGMAKSIFRNKARYSAAEALQKEGLDKAANAIIDAKMSKVANKLFKNTANKVSAERVINYVNSRAKTLIPLGLKEGTEEGQQQLLLNRYQRGEYDNYTDPTSMFCIDSLMNDLDLGADAIGCYLGINSGDPDNGDADLRKAMNIGFTTSMFFRAPHAATNILRSNADNTRNLIASIKNDRVLRTMVADNYGKAQDKDHVGIFFDAMTKSGVTRERLNDSLEAMKKYKGEGVTDDYIDADKELVDRTWSVYKSDHVNNELLPNLGIDKNSSQHRQLVQTAVRDINDFANAVQRTKDQGDQFEEAKNKIVKDAVDHMLGQTIYDELNDKGEFEHKNDVLTDKEIEDLQRDHTIKNLRRVNQNSSISKLTDALNDEYDRLAESHDLAHVELKNDFFKEYDEQHKDDADKPTDEQRLKAWEDEKKSKIETLSKSEDLNDKKKLSAYLDKLTKDEFTKLQLNNAIGYHLLGVLNDVYATLKHKEQLNELVRTETGTDIDTTGLKSMTDYLKGVMDRDSKVYSKVKSGVLGSIDGVEELDRLAKQFYINSAMSAVLQNKAAIYNDSINFDADTVKYNVRETLWSELTKEEKDKYRDKINKEPNTLSDAQIARRYNQEQKSKHKDVYDNVNKYKAKVKDIHKKGLKTTKNDLKQLKSYQRKIQIALAQKDLHESYVRNYIANRTKKEVTSGQDIDDIEDNNKHAIDKNNIFDISNIDEDVVDTEVLTYRSGNLSGKMLIIKLKSNPEASLYLLKQDGIDGKYGVSYADKCSDLTDEEKAELVQQVINALPKGSYLTLNDGYITINNNDLLDYAGKFLKHDPQYEVVSSADDYGNSVNYTLYLKDKDDIIVPKPKPKAPSASESKPLASPAVPLTPPVAPLVPLTPPIAPEPEPESLPEDTGLEVNQDEEGVDLNSVIDNVLGGNTPKHNEELKKLKEQYNSLELAKIEQKKEDSRDECEILDDIDHGLDYTGITVSTDNNGLNLKSAVYKDHLSRTFFYNPDDESNSHIRYSNGKELDFGKEIGSGKELAEKLLDSKWIKSCDTYYVVSGNRNPKLDNNMDNLVVNLIIEEKSDNGKVYIVSMRGLGENEYEGDNGKIIRTLNGETNLYNFLAYTQIGLSPNKDGRLYFENQLDGSTKTFDDLRETYATKNGRRKEYQSNQDIMLQINDLKVSRNKIISAYCDVNSNGDIIMPNTVRKNKVIPEHLNVSNGKFTKTGVLHTLVGKELGFGLSDDIEEMSSQIGSNAKDSKNGKILFGYGTGAFAEDGNQFQIFGMHSTSDDQSLGGYGLAGKIYCYINNNLPGTNNSSNGVALMLHELRFDIDQKVESPDEVKLHIDPKSGKANLNENPTAAEILLYLLCDRINKNDLPEKVSLAILDMAVHNGPKTLLNFSNKGSEKQKLNAKLPYYQDKQLCFEQKDNGDWVLQIGDSTMQSIPGVTNKYRHEYKISELFPVRNASEDEIKECYKNRQQAVYLLSNNFHWNTDKNDLFTDNNIDIVSEMSDFLNDYFDQNPNITEFKLFDNDLFTFKKSDFLDKDGNLKNIDIFAWMLKNDKLTTDVASNKFENPFVFADGAINATTNVPESKPKSNSNSSKTNINSNNSSKKDVSSNFSLNNDLKSEFEDTFNMGVDNFITAEEYRKQPGGAERKKPNGTIRPRFEKYDYLYPVYEKGNGEIPLIQDPKVMNDYLDVMAKKLYEYAKYVHNQHKEYPIIVNKHEIDITDKNAYKKIREILNDPEDNHLLCTTVRGVQLAGFLLYSSSITRQVAVINNIVQYIKDSKGLEHPRFRINLEYNRSVNNNSKFTGVYLSNKSNGKLNAKLALSWLAKTLGIDEGRVIVLHALERSASSKEVFGVTKLVTDSVTNEMYPIIALSKKAGRGVPYHEAWHYVNLLINTPSQRQDLYEEYMDTHNISDNTTFAEVEEMMAEDFRRYCERKEGTKFTDKLKRLFDNILTFLRIYKKNDLIQQVYDAIRRGDFKGRQLDPASVKEFNDVYGGYVNSASYTIPGVSQDTLDKFTAIKDYKQFYDISLSLVQSLIYKYGLTTPEDVNKASYKYFDQYLNDLEDSMEDISDQETYDTINDIVTNKIAFANIMDDTFKKLGIDSNFGLNFKDKLIEKDQNKDTGEEISEHDIDHFSVSKKINVSFRARLFLMQIPNAHFEYSKDKNGNTINSIVYDKNKMFEGNTFVPFDVAWKNILQELWFCDSYDKKDQYGKYLSTSIVGRINELADESAFFYALKNKIDSIGTSYDKDGNIKNEADIELLNQIFGTIVSQMPNVTFIKLSDPSQLQYDDFDFSGSMDDIELQSGNTTIADRDRQWKLYNDNTLKAKRNIPRKWSSNLYTSGLMTEYNSNDKEVVNLNFIDNAKKLRTYIDNIKDIYIKDSNDNNFDNTIKHGRIAFKYFCKLMLIPIGNNDNVYNRFVIQFSDIKHNMSPKAEAEAILNMFELATGRGNKKIQSGSIRNILNIISSVETRDDKSSFAVGRNYKNLDLLLSGYGENSLISKLASAYNEIYPSSAEFTVTGPDGKPIYPVSQNNYYSDRIRELNDGDSNYVNKLSNSEYCKHSVILKLRNNLLKSSSESVLGQDDKFKLCLIKGLGDNNNKDVKGVDYMGLTPTEDYLSKLNYTFNNMLVLPTMGDKPTYYTIKNSHMNTIHDLITYDGNDEQGNYRKMKFSELTLHIFYNYYLDELNSLKQYYNEDNIKYLINHRDKLIINYHGKVHEAENGRLAYLDFSGNGGKFRYFYNVINNTLLDPNEDLINVNINQLFELEYKRQKAAMDAVFSGNETKADRDFINRVSKESNKAISELDGFENVRRLLDLLADPSKHPYSDISIGINNILIKATMQELENLSSTDGVYSTMNIVSKSKDEDGDIIYLPKSIPSEILNYYADRLNKYGYSSHKGSAYDGSDDNSDYTLSAIGSHVANTMMSIIESEKIFSGDPAFYKWKYLKDTMKVAYDLEGHVYDLSILKEKHSDKVKRLGAVLSPGENLRVDYGLDILKIHPELNRSTYTFANIGDINAKSVFLDSVKDSFKRQELINYIVQHHDLDLFKDITEEDFGEWYKDIDKFNLFYKNLKDAITYTTFDDNFRRTDNVKYENLTDEEFESLSKDPAINNVQSMKRSIEKSASQAVDPISDITVSDAQVCIRPAMYRMLRIELGEWTFNTDDKGYSDEIAYQTIEKDDSWMHDRDKQKLISRFQLKPLKMTYFSNENRNMYGDNDDINTTANVPVYNKMAIFPMFKYACTNKTGVSLYNRMNKKGNEIDMLGFESAVKVGCNQKMYKPFPKGTSDLDDLLKIGSGSFDDSTSTNFIDLNGNASVNKPSDNQITTQIQYIDRLRLQLNTDAHEATERPAGTLFFKLCFSNIDDNKLYKNFADDSNRTGKLLKGSIMNTINKLTYLGSKSIVNKYIKNGEEKKIKSVKDYINNVARNNGVEPNMLDILNNGACASSSPSRLLYEQSISKMINGKVIDINMQGGSAIQQSVFGFTGVNNNTFTYDLSVYHRFNNGKEIKYISKGNTMQVLLSMNLFRSVLPNELWNDGSYDEQRQWLIDHDVICGTKTDNTESDPNPFGIGYRIPTQGMSSIFAFQVADILPKQSGDTIIVPREFTALTGSDFDVDKLFMVTTAYDKEGNPYAENKDVKYDNNQKLKICLNKLLFDYMDVITAMSNFKQSRGSLDTITDVIKNQFLPQIEEKSTEYKPSGYELIPSFQGKTKMEFATGKTGIGAFALSVTNLALTQFVNLTMDYKLNKYNFGDLYNPLSNDGTYVADWLSAMINAHVDVAKDPYIFTLNINNATYNYITFLLRAGKSISTFSFIAQPAIKQYANMSNDSNSIYGNNIDGKSEKKHQTSDDIIGDIFLKYCDMAKKILDDNKHTAFSTEQKLKFDDLLNKFNFLTNNIADDNDELKNKINREIINEIFDTDAGIWAIQNPTKLKSIIFLMESIRALSDIQPYANALSALVNNSRIDTKKFGNSIATLINFVNNYMQFRYGKLSNMFITQKQQSDLAKGNVETDDLHNALDDYFDNTFLSSKLEYATDLTRTLLRGQTFTASDMFEHTFKNIMMDIYGYDIVTISRDNINSKYIVYNGKSTEDFTTLIGNAIDNVMRYRALDKYSSLADGTIDIARKEDDVRKTMIRLIGGLNGTSFKHDYYEGESIFNNIRILKRKIETEDKYSYLKDNEFLRYISPVATTSSDIIKLDRLSLSAPQMDLSVSEKTILTSAFDQLLRSDDYFVKRLAEDLVLYGYYSQYDQGGINSYFDIVPAPYRKQYDNALSKAAFESATKPGEFSNNLSESESQYSIEDVIAKNYWYDDNIIKPYIPTQKIEYNTMISIYSDCHLCETKYNGLIAYGAIISSKSDKYFKVKVDNNYILYKNAGVMTLTGVNGNNKNVQFKNIYIPIEKAGLHGGRIHQFEFYVSPIKKTIFSGFNSLNDGLLYNNVKALIQQKFNNIYKTGELDKYSISSVDMKWEENEDNKESDISANDNKPLIFDTEAEDDSDVITNKDGSVQFIPNENIQTDVKIEIDGKYTIDSLSNDIITKVNNDFNDKKSLKLVSPIEQNLFKDNVKKQFDAIFEKVKSQGITISDLHVNDDEFATDIARSAKYYSINYPLFIENVIVDVTNNDHIDEIVDNVDKDESDVQENKELSNLIDKSIESIKQKDDSSDAISEDIKNRIDLANNVDIENTVSGSELMNKFGLNKDNAGKTATKDSEDKKNHEACSK